MLWFTEVETVRTDGRSCWSSHNTSLPLCILSGGSLLLCLLFIFGASTRSCGFVAQRQARYVIRYWPAFSSNQKLITFFGCWNERHLIATVVKIGVTEFCSFHLISQAVIFGLYKTVALFWNSGRIICFLQLLQLALTEDWFLDFCQPQKGHANLLDETVRLGPTSYNTSLVAMYFCKGFAVTQASFLRSNFPWF